MKPSRRQFLKDSTAMLGAGPLLASAREARAPKKSAVKAAVPTAPNPNLRLSTPFAATQGVWILTEGEAGFQLQLAGRELARGLRNLGLAREPIVAPKAGTEPATSDTVFTLTVNQGAFQHPEAYEISQETVGGIFPRVRLSGATPQAVLYAVFDFLERQGAFFGLDGEVYPLEPAKTLNTPPSGQNWKAQPRFRVRGLVPWPDFLNCITVFNREELRAYLEAMVRMRFNTLGIHVYSGKQQWTESFLTTEYGGVGAIAYTDTTATNRWGYLPERTSHYGMGAAEFYDGEVFGSEATTRARNTFEAQALAQQLWAEVFRYAQQLGVRTGVGFEPYQIPDEIFSATPPQARYVPEDPKLPGPRLDPESVAARDILESRLGSLLEVYPTVDYVWLWEDEGMSWSSQKTSVPLSVTPFQQAYDFLRRHAPQKRLVISGWGGVTRHFAAFHKQLPEDIVFSSLGDNLGWDPVSEEYSKLEGRERWPIPWLEDDPAMWLPQFHVYRFEADMDRAEKFGCQGLMGIHWRHRITDANAGYQARYSWEKNLSPAEYFQKFSLALVRRPAAEKLALLLDETDRNRKVLSSFTGEIKDGHHQIHEYSGDYDEAFQYWNGYEPPTGVKGSQAEVAHALRGLLESSTSSAERERLNYLTRHVEFLVPYAESWSVAYQLHRVLTAAELQKVAGKNEQAREKVRAEGIPLWLKLAPLVREAILCFQEIVSTRNDLGTLASIHNKYERLALFRLRASMKEFLGKLPPEVEKIYEEVRRPDPNAGPRVFVPTRPSFLRAGERVRIFAVAPGGSELRGATLFTRQAGAKAWTSTPMKQVERRTYVGDLEVKDVAASLMDYYVTADFSGGSSSATETAPPEAPARFYTVTLL